MSALLCLSAPLSAKEGDVLQTHVSARSVRDSNVFRLSRNADTQALLGTGHRSDVINTLEAGINVDLPVSRQRFLLDASIARDWYDRFSFLNNTYKQAAGTWQWEAGNQWSGDLGATYKDTLSSFNLLQTTVRDEVEQKRQFFNAGYKFHPDWQIHGGAETYTLRRSLLNNRNRDEDVGKLGVRYTSAAKNYIDLEARYIDASLPNHSADITVPATLGTTPIVITGTALSNDYTQSELNGELDWKFSKSHINAKLGYVRRRHKELDVVDFSGTSERVTYDWAATGKTSVGFSVYRELRSLEDLLVSYAVVKGVSVSPSWAPTAKVSLRGRFAFEKVDFRGDPAVAAGTAILREDIVRSARLTVGYMPIQNTELTLEYENQSRTSTRELADFKYNSIMASVRVDY
ncbi:MAG TPA: XrtB/PEP-CTERM-associated polysaccharide biosynthesis outer membrane protein EpsL [Gammaproteobacteria bacterium]|nr:XrtB/PEP-CTERM-associated polysaccharide biosynthesis outer membrane protein EpsL [Gammaproteobacteria bacterium]